MSRIFGVKYDGAGGSFPRLIPWIICNPVGPSPALARLPPRTPNKASGHFSRQGSKTFSSANDKPWLSRLPHCARSAAVTRPFLHAWALCFMASCSMNRDGVAAQRRDAALDKPMHTEKEGNPGFASPTPRFGARLQKQRPVLCYSCNHFTLSLDTC